MANYMANVRHEKSTHYSTRMRAIKRIRQENSMKQSNSTRRQSCVMQTQYFILIVQHVQSPQFHLPLTSGYAALKQHEKTIEDASAALALNPDYSKALRRRANAYEEIGHDAQALSDWTAVCIIEEFKFTDSTSAVQRVLKRLADTKAAELLGHKPRKLPSPNFVLAYLSSFRPKLWPAVPESPGEGDLALQRAFEFIDQAEFNEAADEVDTAIRLGCKYLPLAFNYSGTFAFIRGDTDVAIAEFNKSLDLDPNQSQVWAKRASVHMEKCISYVLTWR
jgi:mitochondrial import receptor subunit TOM70